MKKNVFHVTKVMAHDTRTEITLSNRKTIQLGPYVYIKVGSLLEFTPSLVKYRTIKKLFNDRATQSEQSITIHPQYKARERIHVPPHTFDVTFRERSDPESWHAARSLEQFHYRGKGFNRLVGRRIVLIAECAPFGVLGYGVLSATVGMARPRFELFRTDFTRQMRSGLINRIARIPRIVIHPEFRGMGVGVLMARHLVRYARMRWDINSYRAVMVEVIAKMTEYHRFFDRAGFIRLGNTQGYDIGIRPHYGNGDWEDRNHQGFDFIGNQEAKPYLVWPLTSEVRKAVIARAGSQAKNWVIRKEQRPQARTVRFRSVSISYGVTNGHSARSRTVRDAFGVDSSQMNTTVLRDLDLTIAPGDVVVVTGASGSGKSTLLKALSTSKKILGRQMHIRGWIHGVVPNDISVLSTDFESSRPLVEQVKQGHDVRDAIELLNSVGLAEAHLYLRQPKQISDGQRYRFAVARLCDSGKPVWIADEFASTLSAEMAAVVAKGLRRLSARYGATLILGAPHVEHFLTSLVPRTLLRLSWGGEAKVYSIGVRWFQDDGRVRVVITNECDTHLSNVEIGVVDVAGSIRPLAKRRRIRPGGQWKTSIRTPNNPDAISLRVITDQGIGDVTYLTNHS